jgi:hypothetical protein
MGIVEGGITIGAPMITREAGFLADLSLNL